MDTMMRVGTEIWASEALPQMTLQLVLRGSNGIVIASDTCMVSSKPAFRFTQSVKKIVIKPKLVYMFSGDDFARDIGEAVAIEAGDHPNLSNEIINEISNRALRKHKRIVKKEFQESYRKIVWVQDTGSEFAIWSALYLNRKFETYTHVDSNGLCSVHAGDDANQARYIVEHYYRHYPVRNVSNLQIMAAHTILTGNSFNSDFVSGLEMVVGNTEGFKPVPREEIQRLTELSHKIHAANDGYFNGQIPIEK